MSVWLAAVIAAVLLLPELLPLSRLAPLAAATTWLIAIAMRAITAAMVAAIAISHVPATKVFAAVSEWCLRDIGPFLSSHLGVSGHGVGEGALLVPALALAISLLWALAATVRGLRSVARSLRASLLGPGPGGTVIVGGRQIFVAAAGLRHPQVIVSAGALIQLDNAELEASLEHERGHIARRHRYLLIVGRLLLALARFVPGSRRAFSRMRFHLERDADEFAVRQGGDPGALARAILKATQSTVDPGHALALAGGRDVAGRLQLLRRPAPQRSLARWSSAFLPGLLATAAILAISFTAPGLTAAGIEQVHKPEPLTSCA